MTIAAFCLAYALGVAAAFVAIVVGLVLSRPSAGRDRRGGYLAPHDGHRGTSKPVPSMRTTSGPRSAVPPPNPKTIQVILREGPPAK